MPYSIVHATQFFEFGKAIADAATVGNQVRLPTSVHPAHGGGGCCQSRGEGRGGSSGERHR